MLFFFADAAIAWFFVKGFWSQVIFFGVRKAIS